MKKEQTEIDTNRAALTEAGRNRESKTERIRLRQRQTQQSHRSRSSPHTNKWTDIKRHIEK